MNKQDLITRISKDTGRHERVTAAAAVDSLLGAITHALRKGDAITFVGFGTFKTTQRRARVAKNPRTGDANQDSKAARRAVHGRQGPQRRP